MTIVYISGPMTGLPEFNYPAFDQAEKALSFGGFDVLNPARHGTVDGFTWADYMRLALVDLSKADAICMLPGWESSRGAQLELHIAKQLCLTQMSLGLFDKTPAL